LGKGQVAKEEGSGRAGARPALTGATPGGTDPVVVIAAARAREALRDLACALARRAARQDFAAAQASLRPMSSPMRSGDPDDLPEDLPPVLTVVETAGRRRGRK